MIIIVNIKTICNGCILSILKLICVKKNLVRDGQYGFRGILVVYSE